MLFERRRFLYLCVLLREGNLRVCEPEGVVEPEFP
jgi:hypothetical protein